MSSLEKRRKSGEEKEERRRLVSIPRDPATCFEIGALYKNTNRRPGGVRTCEALLADVVIMFSALPVRAVSLSSPSASEGEECSGVVLGGGGGVRRWITPRVGEGRSVSSLKGGHFSPVLLLDGARRLLAPA